MDFFVDGILWFTVRRFGEIKEIYARDCSLSCVEVTWFFGVL